MGESFHCLRFLSVIFFTGLIAKYCTKFYINSLHPTPNPKIERFLASKFRPDIRVLRGVNTAECNILRQLVQAKEFQHTIVFKATSQLTCCS